MEVGSARVLAFELRARPIRDAVVSVVGVARRLGMPLGACRASPLSRQSRFSEPPSHSLPPRKHCRPPVPLMTTVRLALYRGKSATRIEVVL
jgi:hypothetical protein